VLNSYPVKILQESGRMVNSVRAEQVGVSCVPYTNSDPVYQIYVACLVKVSPVKDLTVAKYS
jgi:hypothetical protein